MDRSRGWWLLLAGLLWTAAFSLDFPALAAERVVLFDQGHGQRFLIDGAEPLGLSALAAEIRTQGLTPQPLTGGITAAALQDAAALVVSGPFQPVDAAEIAAIADFLGRGGRLCVMLHIAEPVRPLLQRLRVVATIAPVREQVNLLGDNPLAFRVTNLAEHPVTDGLAGFKVNGCWGVANLTAAGRVLAWSSPQAWSDMDGDGKMGPDEPLATLGVMVGGELGQGAFLVIGDDAVFQNQFLTEGNLKMAQNLAVWLKGE